MQYALLIYEDEKVYANDKTGEVMKTAGVKHMAFAKELGKAMVKGDGFKDTSTATTVRTKAGAQSIKDGAAAGSNGESLTGYYVIDVADLDTAIKIAKMLPLAKDGAVEIRPTLGAM